jgi:predicted outer membrane repeat protein
MLTSTTSDVNSFGLAGLESSGLALSQSPFQVDGGSGRSLAFIDAGLSDVQGLMAGLQAGTTVYLLDSAGDGLSQITAVLAGYHDLASVMILSHGSDGALQLGSTRLDSDRLIGQAGLVQSWAGALGEGADLLLYGCNVAADAIGQGFVQQLATLTGADVAASDDLTGSAALGGDWLLEYQTGAIEAAALAVANYASVLATFNVTNTNDAGAGSLRDAIGKANTAPGADTINFTGSIFKDAVPDQITLTSEQLTINSDITINGTGANKLSISGKNGSEVFAIIRGSKVTISGVFITHKSGSGGGILNNGTLTLNNSTVSGNLALYGGGIYSDGTLTLNNSTVSGNTANESGGGISNEGTLTLNNSTVSGNSAVDVGGGIENYLSGTLTLNNSTVSGNSARLGGGIHNKGTSTFNNSTISGNKANDGGGMFIIGFTATSTFNNSTVSGNTSTGVGGGINNGGATNGGGTVTLKSSTVSGNSSAFGGGIFNTSKLALKNSILSGNKATVSGGGLYSNGGTIGLISGTIISGNTAPTNPNTYISN